MNRIHNMCRCCASEGTFKDLSSTYHWMGEEEIYADMLKECFDVYLSSSADNEEGGICEVCITQLRNASNFKKQVLHTEKIFIKKIQDKLIKPDIVKVEVPDDNAFQSDIDHNVNEDFSDLDVQIKEELREESKPKKRAARTTASRAKRAKKEVSESSTKRNRQFCDSKMITSPKTVKMKSLNIHPNCLREDTAQAESTAVKMAGGKNTYPKIVDNEGNADELEKQLHNIKQILTHSNATPIRRCFGLGYSCCYCPKEFQNPSELKVHALKTHTDVTKASFFREIRFSECLVKLDITGLKCNICQDNIHSVELLKQHLDSDHNINIYMGLKRFVIPFKFETSQLQCYICSTNFHKFKSLLEHMKVHYQNHMCGSCSSGFITLNQLKSHEKTHQEIVVPCHFCSLTFNDYKKKNNHEHLKHGAPLQDARYRCRHCGDVFKYFHSKERHLRAVHGVKSSLIECKACGKTFTSSNSYSAHLRIFHLSMKEYKCSICDKSFSTSNMLKYHEVSHSKIKNFECEICSKMYINQKTLRAHMKTHENVAKFKCMHCDRNFLLEHYYIAHVKNKHGDSDLTI